MQNILEFIPNLKILYLILIILIMTIINIILNKKQIASNYKYLINGIALIALALITNYFSDIIEGIFNLNFLSVKFYIVILIITNTITLITIQKKIRPIYKIINYLLFGFITIFLSSILIIVTGTKLKLLSSSISQYSIVLLNISIIIFIIYLTIISTIYIIKNLSNKETIKVTKSNKLKETAKEKIHSLKNLVLKRIKTRKKIETKKEKQQNILSLEELLTLSNKEEFRINGVECSIIFEDSIPENIIKNYHILLNDINDKLVNGYTLEENKLLKSICTKLQVNNLKYIDIKNISILNKISVEEYNFLKQIYED